MASITIVLTLMVVGIVLIPALIWLWWWNISFIHRAIIFRQTGRDVSDVVRYEDKFKVVEKNGQHVIVFKRQRTRSPSFPGSVWLKWMKNKTMKFNPEDWVTFNMSKNISRGLLLYQTTEGEYHPITMIRDTDNKVHFKILPQDNRGFISRNIATVDTLTMSGKKQLIAVIIVVVALLILALAFVMFLVYGTEYATNICGSSGNTALETATKVIGG